MNRLPLIASMTLFGLGYFFLASAGEITVPKTIGLGGATIVFFLVFTFYKRRRDMV